jgi:hypothetical protein
MNEVDGPDTFAPSVCYDEASGRLLQCRARRRFRLHHWLTVAACFAVAGLCFAFARR